MMNSIIPEDYGRDEAFKNPMVRLYGKGPAGKKCKNCKHLYLKELAGRYFKCALRIDTNGLGSDHRVNWHACKMFEEKE